MPPRKRRVPNPSAQVMIGSAACASLQEAGAILGRQGKRTAKELRLAHKNLRFARDFSQALLLDVETLLKPDEQQPEGAEPKCPACGGEADQDPSVVCVLCSDPLPGVSRAADDEQSAPAGEVEHPLVEALRLGNQSRQETQEALQALRRLFEATRPGADSGELAAARAAALTLLEDLEPGAPVESRQPVEAQPEAAPAPPSHGIDLARSEVRPLPLGFDWPSIEKKVKEFSVASGQWAMAEVARRILQALLRPCPCEPKHIESFVPPEWQGDVETCLRLIREQGERELRELHELRELRERELTIDLLAAQGGAGAGHLPPEEGTP